MKYSYVFMILVIVGSGAVGTFRASDHAPYGSTPVPSYAQKISWSRANGSTRELFASPDQPDIRSLVLSREMAAQMKLLRMLSQEGIALNVAYRAARDVMDEFARAVELENATREAFRREEYVPSSSIYEPYVARIVQKVHRAVSITRSHQGSNRLEDSFVHTKSHTSEIESTSPWFELAQSFEHV